MLWKENKRGRNWSNVYSTEQIGQLENGEHYMCWCRNVRNSARRMPTIKCSTANTKASFNAQKILCTSKLNLNVWKKLIKCYMCSIALYGAETCDTSESRSGITWKFWNVELERWRRSVGTIVWKRSSIT